MPPTCHEANQFYLWSSVVAFVKLPCLPVSTMEWNVLYIRHTVALLQSCGASFKPFWNCICGVVVESLWMVSYCIAEHSRQFGGLAS